jgi:hypothetical protein
MNVMEELLRLLSSQMERGGDDSTRTCRAPCEAVAPLVRVEVRVEKVVLQVGGGASFLEAGPP